MYTSSRAPLIAICLLVLLRMSIGWQFLYEGLWKYDTLDSPTPWSAEGYLKAAQGPFRRTFLGMTGDPYDQDWMNFDKVSANWYSWRDRFTVHYGLDEKQRAELNQLLDGVDDANSDPAVLPPRTYSRPLAALPTGVNLKDKALGETFSHANGQLTANQPVKPDEEAALKSMAPGNEAFAKTVEALAKISRDLSFRQRLAANLRGDPERTGVIGRRNDKGSFEPVMGTVTAAERDADRENLRYGKVQEYEDLIMEYESGMNAAKVEYQLDHLSMINRKLQLLKNELVGPIRALDKELKEQAMTLLTGTQLSLGAPPLENTPTHQASMRAMWGLIIIGGLLIVGFCSRIAAVAGAVMLLSFYLVVPPWPGVPQPPGPEHSFIINKNAIEIIALMAIAALPTGTWFGIDGIISRYFLSRDEDEY